MLYSSDHLRCVHVPRINPVSVEQQLFFVLSVAERRDHHTRYARMREFQRGLRLERNGQESLARVSRAMRAVLDIVHGRHENVETALAWNGIKGLPKHMMPEIERLWALAPSGEKGRGDGGN